MAPCGRFRCGMVKDGEDTMSELKIGWSEVSITPDKKASLEGQFYERISQYTETEITATAMAIESEGAQLIICSCDMEGIGYNLVCGVREKLKAVEGIDPEMVIIHATHSHTSIKYTSKRRVSLDGSLNLLSKYLGEETAVKPQKRDDVMEGDEGLYFLIDRIAQAVKQAWENRRPAAYANAFGRAAVGMNRRVCYSDGSAKMWGDTNTATFTELEGGNDSGMELLFVYDEKKALTGIVANVACPAQVLEQRSFFSADYWGKVKILLRERFGKDLFVLGLCSAAGDQCPRDLVRWVDPETPIDDPNVIRTNVILRKADPSMYDIKGTWKIGKRIAREIIDVYDEIEDGEIRTEAPLVHENIILEVPVRRVTDKEYNEAKEKIDAFVKTVEKITFAENAKMHVYAGTIARYEMQEKYNLYPAEIHIARFGDIAFASNSFELFLNYGNQIRARSKAQQTFLIQLACGADGYLPTLKAEQGSHYSAYVSSGVTGHEGGDLLVRKTVAEINKMFDR